MYPCELHSYPCHRCNCIGRSCSSQSDWEHCWWRHSNAASTGLRECRMEWKRAAVGQHSWRTHGSPLSSAGPGGEAGVPRRSAPSHRHQRQLQGARVRGAGKRGERGRRRQLDLSGEPGRRVLFQTSRCRWSPTSTETFCLAICPKRLISW